MPQLEALDQSVIFRNPLPGHRVINAFYPYVLPLPNGEWICVIRTAGALYSPEGMMELFRTSDQGKTWQRVGPLFKRPAGPVQHNYLDGTLTQLRDGSIVLRTMRAIHGDPDALMYNTTTQGLLPFDTVIIRSKDGGRTWSEPVVPDLSSHFDLKTTVPAPYGGVNELESGEWMLLFDTWKSYDNAGPFDLNPWALFSRDGGRTWRDRTAVADGKVLGKSYSHGSPVPMSDGRFFISHWSAEPQLQEFFGLSATVSSDKTGRRWEKPRDLNIPGQSSHAVDMGSGRMLIIYSHREGTEQPGLKVVASTDGGRTFDTRAPLVVWDAYGKEALGVARSSTYPSSHDAIAYGAPKIVKLDDTHAIASWWCTQGGDVHCRCCKVRVNA